MGTKGFTESIEMGWTDDGDEVLAGLALGAADRKRATLSAISFEDVPVQRRPPEATMGAVARNNASEVPSSGDATPVEVEQAAKL